MYNKLGILVKSLEEREIVSEESFLAKEHVCVMNRIIPTSRVSDWKASRTLPTLEHILKIIENIHLSISQNSFVNAELDIFRRKGVDFYSVNFNNIIQTSLNLFEYERYNVNNISSPYHIAKRFSFQRIWYNLLKAYCQDLAIQRDIGEGVFDLVSENMLREDIDLYFGNDIFNKV